MEGVIKSKKPFSPRAWYTVAFKAQVIDDYFQMYKENAHEAWHSSNKHRWHWPRLWIDLEISTIDTVIAESRAWEMESHIQYTISSVSSEDYEIELNDEIFAL